MSGTLFGIPLSQPVDVNGVPYAGNLLYIYIAGTNTPANTYQDFGLTILNPFPLTADASGRIPPFWVADGVYRARLTTSQGVLIYDFDTIQALGPSTGTIGGGGGGIDSTSVAQTGDPLWVPLSGTRAGWVRLNARTIGSASSGAVERANADVQALFEFCWANFSDALCPVTGGRGGSALSDWLANKPMGTLDMRGRGPFGLDDMGNSAAGVITGGTSAAASGGAQAASITVAQANLPSFTLPNTLSVASHTHGVGTFSITNGTAVARSLSVTTDSPYAHGGGQVLVSDVSATSSTLSLAGSSAGATATISGSVTSGGSGTALTPSILNPYRLGSWYMKLSIYGFAIMPVIIHMMGGSGIA